MNLNFKIEDDLWWTAEVTLPYWEGFESSYGAFGSTDPKQPSKIHLIFAPEGRDTEPLNEYELNLIEWFVDHKEEVSESVMKSLLLAYPSLQATYGYTEEEKVKYMPDVSSTDDFRKLIGLQNVNIHQIDNQGIPYMGFEFECTWDEEHGLGVLMNGYRMVDIGGADTAILLWIAERDAQKT